MGSIWNQFVKRVYNEGRKKHGKSYQFKQALKDASRRKGEMSKLANKGELISTNNKTKRKIHRKGKHHKNNDDMDTHECVMKCRSKSSKRSKKNMSKRLKRKTKRKGARKSKQRR